MPYICVRKKGFLATTSVPGASRARCKVCRIKVSRIARFEFWLHSDVNGWGCQRSLSEGECQDTNIVHSNKRRRLLQLTVTSKRTTLAHAQVGASWAPNFNRTLSPLPAYSHVRPTYFNERAHAIVHACYIEVSFLIHCRRSTIRVRPAFQTTTASFGARGCTGTI
jgi:hypothetical protein